MPVGSNYTMDIDEAITAAKWLEAKHVIPMHYDTFDLIKADTNDFKTKIEMLGKKCTIMRPGETITIK